MIVKAPTSRKEVQDEEAEEKTDPGLERPDFDETENEATRLDFKPPEGPDDIPTRVINREEPSAPDVVPLPAVIEEEVLPVRVDEFSDQQLRSEKTRIIQRPKELLSEEDLRLEKEKAVGVRRYVPQKSFLVLAFLTLVAYEALYEDEDEVAKKPQVNLSPIRPQLPGGGSGDADPARSTKLYLEGLDPYREDTVQGYIRAAEHFHKSLRLDPQNVKALAMLASCYLNTIESSNKDERTFLVINKLIELSKTKQLDLVETLIAEVEFLVQSKRYDAAIQRIVEYGKVYGKLDAALYFSLGWVYVEKGDYGQAMKNLDFIPASALKIPKLYYLRGFLHEQNKEYDQAAAEYNRALGINKRHAKSILGLIRISEKKGELMRELRNIEFLVGSSSLQSPKEYVQALIYRAKVALLNKSVKGAIESLEQALRVDPKNEALRLEYYSILAASEKDTKYKDLAKMYTFILDGDRNSRAGKTHEATTAFLQAQDTFPKSYVPVERMGDLFHGQGEYNRAQAQFKRALELAQQSKSQAESQIAVKLIDSLIRNHDWDEASRVMAKYRNSPKLRSAIDRLAGDLAYHQKNYVQAISFYRKAMSRDTIDTEVYSSYANVLRETENFRDAQFFYSIAQRLDPFNTAAIVGAAKCLLKTNGVTEAVSRIQDELARLPRARADLLSGIAEIFFMAQEYEKALRFTEDAQDIDSDYPDSYRIQGDIYLREIRAKKENKKKALEAFKAYSDRKVSDPYGYLQRFEIFIKDGDFEQAEEALQRVSEVSPRYPELHYRRAKMLGKMGRTKDALVELEREIEINPRHLPSWLDLGEIRTKAGDLEEAAKSFNQAMTLDPQSPFAKIGAGYVNYLRRQYGPAIALYQAALALDKGNPEVHKKLGLAYRDSGDQPSANRHFQLYVDLAPDAPDRADVEAMKR